ncbi:hypothetical protein DFJ73DRAFT_790600 [Zopfochytrium polystomum]|nr:hypothetical protein DFJ73DRAFT_790600 [Zopfochytrium polystomum]
MVCSLPIRKTEKKKNHAELIAVSQHNSALELLHDIMMSKRSRTTPLTTLEPIMLKFVELAVVLKKGKTAKEGLHQYKNISQNITVTSIEVVIKRFIELTEVKVAEAQAKAEQITLDNVEDLEATETPESILLSTVSGDVSKDRTDREVVTPWLKFLWEAYRTALDILRNNARLELLYQTVASQAFKFCLKYTRKTEFRRLCELLRQHLTTSAKYSHQTHAINLNDPDTLQRHLDTRFDQLNAAAELELWQEAFRSVEDIHNLLGMSKKPVKLFMMGNYYEKLARIFLVGDNYLFHAAAWSKYYATVRLNKSLPEEEHQRMSSIVLVSALSIPIISTAKSGSAQAGGDETKPKTLRLTNLLRVAKTPTREALLKEALNKNVFGRVLPELRELHNILEVQFHPLSICRKIAPIIAKIAKHPQLGRYARPLHQVILTRLLQQLSQVYETITMDSIVNLATFPESDEVGFNYDAQAIEKFIMNGCRKGELSIRINHMTNALTFESDVFSGAKGSISDGPKLQSLPSEQMRLHLTKLAKRLHTAVELIEPERAAHREAEHFQAVKEALEEEEEERRLATERRILIEKKKELRENALAKKAREEEQKRRIRQAQEAEAERLRAEEEAKKREEQRIAQLNEQMEKSKIEAIAKAIEAKGQSVDGTKDIKDIKALEQSILAQERKELVQKIKNLSRRIDHTERAFRKEEIPLWAKDYEAQQVRDKEAHEALAAKKKAVAEAEFEIALKSKKRLERMKPDYETYRKSLQSKLEADYEAKLNRSTQLIEQAKQARIAEIRRLRAEREERIRREEEERVRREEEERIAREEAERLAAEKAAKDEERRKADAELRKKLDEQAEKQRERERLAEEKIRLSQSKLNEPSPRERESIRARPAEPTPWRRSTAAAEEVAAPARPAGEKWRPPSLVAAAASPAASPAVSSDSVATSDKPNVWRPRRLAGGEGEGASSSTGRLSSATSSSSPSMTPSSRFGDRERDNRDSRDSRDNREGRDGRDFGGDRPSSLRDSADDGGGWRSAGPRRAAAAGGGADGPERSERSERPSRLWRGDSEASAASGEDGGGASPAPAAGGGWRSRAAAGGGASERAGPGSGGSSPAIGSGSRMLRPAGAGGEGGRPSWREREERRVEGGGGGGAGDGGETASPRASSGKYVPPSQRGK